MGKRRLMEVPRWKRWLSYLTEVHVESAPSEVNPHLYVSMRNGRYQLSTANAIYSYEDLYTNFLYAFRQIDFARLPGRDVLLLGLGLGSVPVMLERVFNQDFSYLAVELDPHVIYLANTYALSGLSSPVTTICADAFAYTQQLDETFALICMDIFLDDVIPAAFLTASYLETLRGLLQPGGVLLYNCLYRNPEDKRDTEAFYTNIFQQVFPNATSLDVQGNWILVSDGGVVG
jgi:spermidine synthase